MNKTEVEKAHRWRLGRNLSLEQLAQLTGYSRAALYWYFRGVTPPRSKQRSKPIEAPEWQRFKNLCAGVEWQLQRGKAFDF